MFCTAHEFILLFDCYLIAYLCFGAWASTCSQTVWISFLMLILPLHGKKVEKEQQKKDRSQVVSKKDVMTEMHCVPTLIK